MARSVGRRGNEPFQIFDHGETQRRCPMSALPAGVAFKVITLTSLRSTFSSVSVIP